MPNGRPPKLHNDKQVIELGKDLLEWVNSTAGKSSVMWVEWYNGRHNMFRNDWKTLIQRPGFLPYYESARQYLTRNIMTNKDIPQSYGNRYLHRYDDELNEDEEMSREREAQRGKDAKQYANLEQLQILSDCLSRAHRKELSSDIEVEENHSALCPSS